MSDSEAVEARAPTSGAPQSYSRSNGDRNGHVNGGLRLRTHDIAGDEVEEDDEDDEDLGGSGSGDGSGSPTFPWTRPRNGSGSTYPTSGRLSPEPQQNIARLQRPAAPVRTPSSTYAPLRHPGPTNSRPSRSDRPSRRDPHALYRSQEKAYVQTLRQNADRAYFNAGMEMFYQAGAELEDESPSDMHFDNDQYDGDTLMFYAQDDMEPSAEDLKIPANRERLEWHSMLASVLMGDVVAQEKRRLIGSTEEQEGSTMRSELFLGMRARVCGRSITAQRRMVDDGRAKADALIDEVINFEIRGRDRTDKTANEQVQDILLRWERCEQLWPTRAAMMEAKPNCASQNFLTSLDAIVSWNNITQLINTELLILQNWVGNEELDFRCLAAAPDDGVAGIDHETSFLDRILKDDNLKSLTGESNMLVGLSSVVRKAKTTLIEYSQAFDKRHLPPYIEDLLALIGFPTRLIEEVIGMRVKYAERMREPVSMIADQLISQFQSVLQLAVKIKQEYNEISQPQPGWDLPPCMDENFEQVVLQGLKYYFKLIGMRIGSNRNTFKEAEILETEWHFSNEIGRFIEGGDIEVAEHFRFVDRRSCLQGHRLIGFSSLTSRLLSRLMLHFEKELQKPPEKKGDELSKRYKSILDSVRVRQRKLFRFARLVPQ